ncbi:MAG: hypothetical protein JNK26_00930, partial [Candidatus Doudnabacteria bacterium]|nr:hypothetical protein [Candidatus Doudnabacteria bacterium]
MLFLSRRIKEKPDAHQFQNYARKEWLRKFVRPIVLGLIPVLTFIVIYGNQQHIWASQEDMTGLREHLTLAQETPEEVPTESGP